MVNIKQLKEQRAAIVSQMRTLNEQVEQRESAQYTDEERRQFDSLRSQVKELDERIANAEFIEEADRRTAEQRGSQNDTTAAETRTEEQAAQEQRSAFLAMMRGQAISPEQRTALTVNNSSVIIPKLISDQIIDNLVGQFDFLKNIDVQITAHAKTFVEPTLTGDLALERIDTTEEQSEGTVSFGGIEIKAYDYRLPVLPVSLTLLDGTDLEVEQALVKLFTEHIARGLTKLALTDGTGTDTITALVKGLPSTPVTAAESDSVSYTDLVNLRAAVKAPFASTERGRWIMNSNTMSALLGVTDTTGRPIFNESARVGEPDRLLGRPVVIDDTMPDIAPGKMPIIFGDLKCYRLRIVRGIRVQMYEEEKYMKNLCKGLQAFIVADGKTLAAEGVHPYQALKMASA